MSVRKFTLPALTLINVALAGWLAHQWLEPDGTPRVLTWSAPAPIAPDLTGLASPVAAMPAWDMQRVARLQDRPLFSPSRRPPPPPAPAAPPPPPDPLEKVHVYGVFVQEGGGGGVLMQVEGKVRRFAVGARVGPWTIKAVNERGVQLQRGAQTRTLQIKQVAGLKAAPALPASRASASQGRLAPNARGAASPPPASESSDSGDGSDSPVVSDAPAAAPAVAAPQPAAATAEERRAARQRLINERRAARGLPPLSQ